MDILLYYGLFIVAIFVLVKGSDWFVESAEAVGLSLGISPYIIGVTIVAFGTSLPELASSIAAVLGGEPEIVIGNVVGSNITNIALVLGLTALVVKKIELEYNIWHVDMPFLWASAFLLYFMLLDSRLSLFEAIILLIGVVVFLAYSFRGNDGSDKADRPKVNWKHYTFLFLGGLFVWLGAKYVVVSIQEISSYYRIGSEKIALTAVALGTSLPEIVVSITAARKGKAAIAVGNVLGSNIFNTFVVMSIPSFFGTLIISEEMLTFYLPLMIIMTIMFGIISNNRKITFSEGCLLLMFYGLFFAQIIGS